MSVGTLGDNPPKSRLRRDTCDPFSETLLQTMRRSLNAVGYRLNPRRIADVPYLALATVSALVEGKTLPDSNRVRSQPDGFAGLVRDLDVGTLLEAHRRGFFVHGHLGPQKWWSPSQRAVLMLEAAHLPRRARGLLRNKGFTISVNADFRGVIAACAKPRSGRYLTWLTPRVLHAYARLADAGHAHSIEIRDAEGALVGGLFGVSTGRVFSVLSMFHTRDHASKVGLICLHHELRRRGFVAVDFQFMKPIVEQLGYVDMPRDEFHALMAEHAVTEPAIDWAVTIDPAEVASGAGTCLQAGEAKQSRELRKVILNAGVAAGFALCGIEVASEAAAIEQAIRMFADARRPALAFA